MVALSLTDTLAEMLLGAEGFDEDFDGISDVLSAVKDLGMPDPDADFSYLIHAAARESRLTQIERYATEREPRAQVWQTRLVPRIATAAAALILLVTMSGGMAYAANGAKPGDLLYGLDLAFEAIGIGDGGAEERLAETIALVASRVEPSGPFHASEILTSPTTSGVEEQAQEEQAQTTGTDEHGDAAQEPEASQGPREGRANDAGEDKTSLDGEDESKTSIGGPTSEPSADDTDEPTATDEETSGDSTDPTEDPSEVGGDTTDNDQDGDPGDQTDLTDKPPGESPTPETPGTDETLRDVLDQLRDIVDANPGSPLADKVEDAAAKAYTALEELAKTPPDDQAAVGNIEGAIGDLEAAVADGLLDPGHGNQLMDQLAGIVSQLVQN